MDVGEGQGNREELPCIHYLRVGAGSVNFHAPQNISLNRVTCPVVQSPTPFNVGAEVGGGHW